jgi:hypothetical protein
LVLRFVPDSASMMNSPRSPYFGIPTFRLSSSRTSFARNPWSSVHSTAAFRSRFGPTATAWAAPLPLMEPSLVAL